MLVHLGKDSGNADGKAQATLQLHRRPEQPAQQLAAAILEHQNGLAALTIEFQRAHRPAAVQFVLEGIFVGQAIERGRRRLHRGCERDQHAVALAFRAVAPPSAEG